MYFTKPNSALRLTTVAAMLCAALAQSNTLAQTSAARSTGGTLTVLVAPFTNGDRDRRGGADLPRWATDSVATELANSGRFEVLKQSEVVRQAAELGIRQPYGRDELRRIATNLGADAVITGNIAYVLPRTYKGGLEGAEAGLRVRMEEVSYGDLINGAVEIGLSPVKPGETDLDALTRSAVEKAAVKSVRDITDTMLPEGTILMTQTSLTGDTQILINRGSRDGVREGMEMIVLRNGRRVGRIRIGSVFATDAEATLIDTTQEIAPMDHVRATFEMPELRLPR